MQGKDKPVDQKIKLQIHNEDIVQIESTEIIRVLSVCMNPSLTWDRQFEIMKDRIRQSITKLMNIDINT